MENNLINTLQLALKALKLHNEAFKEFSQSEEKTWNPEHQVEYRTSILAMREINTLLRKTYCCKLAWQKAKDAAWQKVEKNCNCEHYHYCDICYPREFRDGGKWHSYKG